MIKRNRDRKINYKPQQHLSHSEWQEITNRAAQATRFMRSDNPIYMILKTELEESEKDILQNRLRETHNFEFNSFAQVINRVIITPKKLQEDETIGQIKLIRHLFGELQMWIDTKRDFEKKEADGDIVIERNAK